MKMGKFCVTSCVNGSILERQYIKRWYWIQCLLAIEY